jgi:hypothetical protein
MPKALTEKQWLKCSDPQAMLRHLGVKASDRKLRLFSCACCRQAWHFVRSKRLKEILPLLEDFADGNAKDRDRLRVNELGSAVLQSNRLDDMQQCLGGELWRASAKEPDRASGYLGELAAAAFGYAAGGAQKKFQKAKKAEQERQVPLLRDIFGNPFRPVAFDAAWRTTDVMLLARGIYDDRASDRMPILADALQDAGCTSDTLLAHCRDATATHVRGCWALDLVLGKE